MRKAAIAGWSIRHPVSITMLSLAVIAVGVFALGKLSVDLLPRLPFPQVRVRVSDPGVPASLMERNVTRLLEQGLAGIDGARRVESLTTEGASQVDLHLPYGRNMATVVRDVNAVLDRMRGELPPGISSPLVVQVDPSRVPVMEFFISSSSRSPQALRAWVSDVFSAQFRSLAGIAGIDIRGGLLPEIRVIPHPGRLAALGLTLGDIVDTVAQGSDEGQGGQPHFRPGEYAAAVGRLDSLGAIRSLPVRLPGRGGDSIPLADVASVRATQEDPRVRVRFNGNPGVKLSIRKQANANTVDVAERIHARLAWMRANGLIPPTIVVKRVSDPSVYVRHTLGNAGLAMVGGGVLALLVVYLFLGSVRGTLIVGTAIPISILATFILMVFEGLRLNVMTLGGLALGVGMLIDNTIVMLDNISRHRAELPSESGHQTAVIAAGEVSSAIIAATGTTLVAVLPFLFVGGLVGMLFQGLVFTISVALMISLVVALTLVPSLAARMPVPARGWAATASGRALERLQGFYLRQLERVLRAPAGYLLLALIALGLTVPVFLSGRQEFLPAMDDGHIRIEVVTPPGLNLDDIDARVAAIEKLVWSVGDVASVSTRVGGRPPRQLANHSMLQVQLSAPGARDESSLAWVDRFYRVWAEKPITGITVRAHTRGIHEWPVASGDRIDIRVQGTDLQTLAQIGKRLVARLRGLQGIRNLVDSARDTRKEFALQVDHARAAAAGIDDRDIGRAMRIALDGVVAGQFFAGDRSYNIQVGLPRQSVSDAKSLGDILLRGQRGHHRAVYLHDVASVQRVEGPARILHDRQQRIVEVSASLTGVRPVRAVLSEVHRRLSDFPLPEGYRLYVHNGDRELVRGRSLLAGLAGLALLLVFVALAVQFDSLRAPAVILAGVPFSLIGVSIPLLLGRLPWFAPMPLSMSVWLGLTLLVGIVVNNAIVLVQYIEQMRRQGRSPGDAIREAARLRMRPILMTTLTAVCGMIPLALGVGTGAEILQPLAMTIVFGLSFSAVVSLLLVPALYRLIGGGQVVPGEAGPDME
jgi:multidrug efflux pump subunit AcrB